MAGILINAVLPGKDYVFDEEVPSDTGVDFSVRNKEKQRKR